MAFKVIVDSNNLRVVIETDSLSPISTFQNFKSVLTFTDLEGVLQFTDLQAANVFIDADTRNLYFSAQYNSPNAESFSFTDSEVLSVGLAKTDTPTITEQLAKAMGVSISDTPTISEELSKAVDFFRVLADTPSVSDAVASVDSGLGKTDSTTVTEEVAKLFARPASDTLSVSEALTQSVGLGKSDTASLADAPALSTALSRADTPTVTEQIAKLVSFPQSDTTSISESDVKDVGKAVDDSSGVPTTKTYTVTVATGTNVYGSGNKFYIDGLPSPGLILNESITYTFDQSDSSNSGHPFRFSTTANGTHNSGSAYTTDVTVNGTPGSAGAYTRIVISSSTPDLHYYCAIHSGMGAETSMQDTGDTTFAVTVATGVNNHGSGNKYYIDGVITPIVHLLAGNTYTFDQSDSSNSNHPFRFSETSNGSHAGGSQYTTGVTTNGTPGSSGAFTRLQVTNATATTLFYYCTNHSGMGGEVNSSLAGTGDLSVVESLARVVSFVRTFTDTAALDDIASASDDLATQSDLVKNNVLTVSESQAFSVSKPGIADTSSISEAIALLLASAPSDSLSMSDGVPVFNVSKALTDSVSIAESINVAGQNIFSDTVSITESTNLNSADGVQDSTSIADTLVHSFGIAIPRDATAVEAVTIAESLVDSFGKSLTDSATISESVSILFLPGGGSILNTAALNTFVLN